MGSANRGNAEDPPDDRIDHYNILLRLQFLAAIGCLLIFLYALRFWLSGEVLRIFAVGVLAAAAALTAGFLFGFIFGVPRTGAEKQAPVTSTEANGAPHDDPASSQAN